ncbi:MAG: guanylate kinase [Clostridia bacterium]|nr:guanylate kinase [Clostridia bacterium]MBQ9921552.1 guanylate kinase [Clostridia bacterium]
MRKGLIFVISGPAGSGKGTVVKLLREMIPDLGFSVSATTRAPRPGEEDGVNYHFMDRERFKSLLEEGMILEHTEYCGNFYGTLKSEAEKVLSEGRDIILEIEVEGALQVKRLMPDECVTVMLIAPDRAELERRLRGRGTETDDVIMKRLERAVTEVGLAENYDYVVVNETDHSEECAAQIKSIITAEHSRYAMMKSTVESYSAE